jgi:putative inorganic carbon (HCO3(-)) transporter
LVAWLFDGRGLVVTAGMIGAAIGLLSARDPVLALAALAATVLGLLVLVAAEAVLLVLLAALPWEAVLHYPTPTVSAVKLLGALLMASFLIKVLAQRQRLRFPQISYAVGAFVLLVTVSLIFSPDPGGGGGTLLRYYLFAGFFFLMIQLVHDMAGVMRVLRVISLSVTAAAIWGLVLFFQGSTRAAGPISDPNDFAYLMATVLPLVVYLIVTDRRWRPVWAACFPIILAAMLATLSRGGVVAIGALLVWALVTGRIKVGGLLMSTAALVVVVGVGLLLWSPVINERLQEKGKIADANVASRDALWRGAIAMSMDHPLTGVGPGRFGVESTDYVRDNPIVLQDPVTHNSYLQILAESGPAALAAFLAFLAGSWVSLSRCHRKCEATENEAGMRLASAVQAALLVALVGALFISEQLASPFWLLGALAAIVPAAVGEHRIGFRWIGATQPGRPPRGSLRPGWMTDSRPRAVG